MTDEPSQYVTITFELFDGTLIKAHEKQMELFSLNGQTTKEIQLTQEFTESEIISGVKIGLDRLGHVVSIQLLVTDKSQPIYE